MSTQKKQTTVNILWTGGWDSTFRILQLSRKNVIIQPFYLEDDYRKSVKNELHAMKNISIAIRKSKETTCTLNDVVTLNINEISKNAEITGAYQHLLNKTFFGGQYDWLARFATGHPDLELAIHQDDKAFIIIKKYGNIKLIKDEHKGDYYIADPEKCPKEILLMFGNFHFPIIGLSKIDMKNEAEKHACTDILHQSWFCHDPINNQACGICNPCKYTIEEGLKYRFSKAALRRYRLRKLVKPIKNTFVFKKVAGLRRALKG